MHVITLFLVMKPHLRSLLFQGPVLQRILRQILGVTQIRYKELFFAEGVVVDFTPVVCLYTLVQP